jgi:hypothetical protein
MLNATMNNPSPSKISWAKASLTIALLLVTMVRPAHAKFWCSDQYGSAARWVANLCACYYPDGTWEIDGPIKCSKPKGKLFCPCPKDAGWPTCAANMCRLAEDLYDRMVEENPFNTWEPPECEKDCYDYGVSYQRDDFRLDESCSFQKKRTCSKHPPLTPIPSPSPSAPKPVS